MLVIQIILSIAKNINYSTNAHILGKFLKEQSILSLTPRYRGEYSTQK